MGKAIDKQRKELEDLRDWCIAILGFMSELSPSHLFDHTKDAVNAAFARGDLRGLKIAAKDLGEWAKGLAPSDCNNLDVALRTQFGRGLREDAQALRSKVAHILERRTIDSEEEYRLLLSRSDEIYADDSKRSELEQINALLAEYETH